MAHPIHTLFQKILKTYLYIVAFSLHHTQQERVITTTTTDQQAGGLVSYAVETLLSHQTFPWARNRPCQQLVTQ